MELQQSHPGPVEVAAVRDKQVLSCLFLYFQRSMVSFQALFVAPRPKRVSSIVKRIKNPTWWTRCVLFICCVSIPHDASDAQDTNHPQDPNNAQDTGDHQ